jgi:hypothetical protein
MTEPSVELIMARALEKISQLEGQVTQLNVYIDSIEAQAGITKSRRPTTSIFPVPTSLPNTFGVGCKHGSAQDIISKSLTDRVEKGKK